MNKFRYLKIKYLIKFNKFKNKKIYENFEKENKYLLIKKKFDLRFLYFVPKMKGIVIRLEKNGNIDVDTVKSIAKCFPVTEIVIDESIKKLENKDIKELYSINRKIILNNRYIEKRNVQAMNEIFECDINTYILILEKTEYLISICKKNFSTQDEQIIYIISQITKYIKYVDFHDYRTCLANALLLGTGVCIDFAITLYKCITDLGYECELISGIGSGTKEDVNSPINIIRKNNHAWNQIKINNVWYNIDITWYLTHKSFDWVLVSDKDFEKDYKHITSSKYHHCNTNYDRKKLQQLWDKIDKYPSVLKEFDKR